MDNGNFIESADKMAKELAKISKSVNIDEEDMLDFIEDSLLPVEQFFANYSCAIMEIETKFKVLNEQFSLKYDGNPIESIHSRIKDYDSIIRKVIRKKSREILIQLNRISMILPG